MGLITNFLINKAVLTPIWDSLFKVKEPETTPNINFQNIEISEAKSPNNTIVLKPECKRFKKAYETLKETYFEDLSISVVAEYLKIDDVQILYDVIDGLRIPCVSLMREFSNVFNVNYKWLTTGESNMFNLEIRNPSCPYNFREILTQGKTRGFFLVRTKGDTSNLGFVLNLNDGSWLTFSKTYEQHGECGDKGRGYIYSTYELCKWIDKKIPNNVGAYIVSKTFFNDLFSGKTHPSSLVKRNNEDVKHTYWAENFSVKNQEYVNDSFCEMHYGKSFVDCLNIVRNYREKELVI